MSTQEPRSPTFDGNEAAERTGTVADVSGIPNERRQQAGPTGQEGEQPKRTPEAGEVEPDEAAQVIP